MDNQSRTFDVTALGELLIDFTQNGKSDQGNTLFEANPGGAPCNVLAMLKNLGKHTAFIGKVGDDQFGHVLSDSLKEVGIDTTNLLFDQEVHTTLAFVHTFEDGDRDFSFYRQPGADMMLRSNEIREDIIANSRCFHYGTLSMTDENIRETTKTAIEIAKKHGLLITFDPNLRPPLWSSLALAKEQISYGLSKCDMVKISEEELEFMTGEKDIDLGVKVLKQSYDIPLILVTMGKLGSKAFYKNIEVEKPSFLQENTIETTGAGDTFCASAINFVLDHGIDHLTEDILGELLTFANAAASIITTRKGALRVMPSKQEVLDFISSRQ